MSERVEEKSGTVSERVASEKESQSINPSNNKGAKENVTLTINEKRTK